MVVLLAKKLPMLGSIPIMHLRSIKRQRFFGDTRGQAMVEAALTMLLLFVFLFAIWEAGRLLQVQQALTDAAREGARRSIAPLTRTTNLATPADVTAVVRNYLLAAHLDPAQASVNVNQAASSASSPGTVYTQVTVTYPYQVMTLFMFRDLNMTLTGQSLMRNETSP